MAAWGKTAVKSFWKNARFNRWLHGNANEAVNQLVLARMSINTITRNFPCNRTHLSPAETTL